MAVLLFISCGKTSCGKTTISNEEWLHRFTGPGMATHSIVEFRVTPRKAKTTYSLKAPAELANLYKTLCNPNLKSFLEPNARGPIHEFDYRCVFDDGVTVEYSGYVKLFADRNYFAIYIPESGGFMEGLCKVIRLEGVLSKGETESVRSMFLGDEKPPPYEAPTRQE